MYITYDMHIAHTQLIIDFPVLNRYLSVGFRIHVIILGFIGCILNVVCSLLYNKVKRKEVTDSFWRHIAYDETRWALA